MEYYDNEDNVEQYIQMADGYDGNFLINRLKIYLPEGSSVLEIGMGPGKDLDLLNEIYRATGSDKSQIFIERYRKLNPGSDILLLDAVKPVTDRKFQAIFSNKVLQHLSYEEMSESFSRQAELLEPGGLILHSLWYGTEIEEFDGLMFYQVTETKLETLIGDKFEVVEINRYTELKENDSIYVLFRFK